MNAADRDRALIVTSTWDVDGHQLAEGIDKRGNAFYAVLGDWDAKNGCACQDCAPHEQLGPLPADWAERLEATR